MLKKKVVVYLVIIVMLIIGRGGQIVEAAEQEYTTYSYDEFFYKLYETLGERNPTSTINIIGKGAQKVKDKIYDMDIVKDSYLMKYEDKTSSTLRNLYYEYESYRIETSYIKDKQKFTVDITLKGYIDKEQSEKVVNEVRAELKALKLEGLNDYDRIYKVNEWVKSKVTYDYDLGNHAWDSYGALIMGRAVCQGYANLLNIALQELGYNSIIIGGLAYNGVNTELHAWNVVKLDKKWYAIDSTWNDVRDGWFLVGKEEMSYHVPNSDSAGYELADTKYNGTTKSKLKAWFIGIQSENKKMVVGKSLTFNDELTKYTTSNSDVVAIKGNKLIAKKAGIVHVTRSNSEYTTSFRIVVSDKATKNNTYKSGGTKATGMGKKASGVVNKSK